MTIGRFVIVAIAALAGGCMLPIRSDLTASVEGVVGKDSIHEITGDYFRKPRVILDRYGNHRGQLLHVRLSTRNNLVLFSDRKHLAMSLRWRFCDNARQEVRLGIHRAFVNGRRVLGLNKPSPKQDGAGRFVYDAILRVRDARPEEDRRLFASGVVEETFDLEREPRDVCVRVRLISKLSGYRTKVARIPKEEIAAALGVDVSSACSRE